MASVLLYGAIALFVAVYCLINKWNKQFNYFKERGIPQLETEFFYGNSRELVQNKKSQAELYRDFYFEFKKMGARRGGIYYSLMGGSWILVDPQLIKKVLTKDFTYFSAHTEKLPGLFFNNLFSMDGEEWKDMRRKLTTMFSSGKIKMMLNIILEKTNGLADLVANEFEKEGPSEIKEILVRYTTDIAGNCGFGIECNSIEDTNSEFCKHVRDCFKKSDIKVPSLLKCALIYAGLAKPIIPNFEIAENFFRDVVRKMLKFREENKVIRKDFLQLMIQLKNKGTITELTNDNDDIYEKTVKEEVISLEDLTGQCMMFFTAGLETSSNTMSYVMMELAQNQEVQKKLREEVRDVLNRHNGRLCYASLQDMTYCDNVIHETLRKHPPLPFLLRICTKNYTIPDSDSVIEKGTSVIIPHWAMHMDPEYFPEPEKFIPERFSAENKNKIKEFTYLPFGEGPRMCLGLRFGMLQSKAGIATLVNKYHFTLNKKTPYPPEYKKKPFLLAVDGGIWLDIDKAD